MTDATTLRANLHRLSGRDLEFAESLLGQLAQRGLSEKQAVWLAKLAAKAAGTAAPEAAHVADVSALVRLFDKASTGLKYPHLILTAGGADYRLSVCGAGSAAPGSLNLTSTDCSYESRLWYGRISREGIFAPSSRLDTATAATVLAALREFAANPAASARAYGVRTGRCCFCGKELTDARSVAVGYGPTCADHYGLPWGCDAPQDATPAAQEGATAASAAPDYLAFLPPSITRPRPPYAVPTAEQACAMLPPARVKPAVAPWSRRAA